VEGMKIELASESAARTQTTRLVNGTFDFQLVPPGIYHVRVIDRSGQVILRRRQSVTGMGDHIVLYIPYLISEPSLAKIVSLSELNHKIARQAQNAFRAGLKAEDAGELQKSIEDFQKAVTIDPRYVQAEVNLAVQYRQGGRLEEAIAHAQRAFDISLGDPDAAHTLTMMLIGARRYAQLERVTRMMLANRQAVSEMHGLLAVSLIGQGRNFDEAFAHVGLAAENFPMVRLLIADTLVETGFPKFAAIEIKHYLQSSTNECERAQLERWVASVDQSPPTVAVMH